MQLKNLKSIQFVRVMEIKIMHLNNCNFSVNKICKVAEVKIMLFKK